MRPALMLRATLPLVLVVLLAGAACSTKSSSTSSGKIEIAAAESSWGSLAAELGGDLVHVTSIVSNPAADPHSYSPTASDSRAIANAKYVIFNGIGYDEWARHIIASNDNKNQVVLDVGVFTSVQTGGNPHRWYFPVDVQRVVDRMVEDFKAIDPAHSTVYDQRKAGFLATAYLRYTNALDTIRQRFTNVEVGASESLFVGIANVTGLYLATPGSFLAAVSAGTEPSAADKATVVDQITKKEITVFIVDPQRSTPQVADLVDRATKAGIPIVNFTETPIPEGATFIDWQVTQLQRLIDTLATATGK
jgi:zinc/manganese transport system substrate-binding protein